VAKLFPFKGQDPWPAKIAGYQHSVYMSPEDSHFSKINFLGSDFCAANKFHPWYDDDRRTLTYYIGEGWGAPPKL